jgi:hypothetical protein
MCNGAPALVETLHCERLHDDAIHFLAHALPKQEAVGWGCLCVATVSGRRTLRRFRKPMWRRKDGYPIPMGRIAGRLRLRLIKRDWKALQLFWHSQHSSAAVVLRRRILSPSLPPDHVTPQFVAGAVMASAVKNRPEKAPEKYRVFLQKGMGLMARIQLVPQPV